MPHELMLIHAEHARAGQQRGAHFPHALVDVEENDGEHQRDAERDLRPDAEPEPEREDRRKHDPRQCIGHFHIGIENFRHGGPPCKPESDQDSCDRADQEGKNRFKKRDPEMMRMPEQHRDNRDQNLQ